MKALFLRADQNFLNLSDPLNIILNKFPLFPELLIELWKWIKFKTHCNQHLMTCTRALSNLRVDCFGVRNPSTLLIVGPTESSSWELRGVFLQLAEHAVLEVEDEDGFVSSKKCLLLTPMIDSIFLLWLYFFYTPCVMAQHKFPCCWVTIFLHHKFCTENSNKSSAEPVWTLYPWRNIRILWWILLILFLFFYSNSSKRNPI